MGTVVGFTEFLQNSRRASAGYISCGQTPSRFTLRDGADLEEWSNPTRHAVVHSCDQGSWAMLYEAGRPWATWGLERQGRSILVWNCVTLVDVDRFPTMVDALAAIASEVRAAIGNVIHFAGLPERPLGQATHLR